MGEFETLYWLDENTDSFDQNQKIKLFVKDAFQSSFLKLMTSINSICSCHGHQIFSVTVLEKKKKNKGSMHLQRALAPEKVKPDPEGRYALSPILMPQPISVHIYCIGFTFPGAFSVFRVLQVFFLFFIFA